jgi:hypothetical protein
MHTGVWWGNPKERDRLQNLGIDGRIIVKRILQETGLESKNWIDLADVREDY